MHKPIVEHLAELYEAADPATYQNLQGFIEVQRGDQVLGPANDEVKKLISVFAVLEQELLNRVDERQARDNVEQGPTTQAENQSLEREIFSMAIRRNIVHSMITEALARQYCLRSDVEVLVRSGGIVVVR